MVAEMVLLKHLCRGFIAPPPKKKALESAFYKVGMTGFEPATLRPPDVYATRLRHIPIYVFVTALGEGSRGIFFWELRVVQFTLNLPKCHIPELEVQK